MLLSRTGLSPAVVCRFQNVLLAHRNSHVESYNPAEENLRGLGYFPFARRY